MTEIVWQRRLISCRFGWPRIFRHGPTFQGLGIWIGSNLASPPPSINRETFRMEINSVFFSKRSYFKVLPSLLRCHVFLLPHQVEERKGEDGDGEKGCWAPTTRETGWHNMSVVVKSLSQHVSRCDMASLSEEMGGLVLQLSLFVWSLACLVQLRSWGLESFPDSVYTVGVGAVLGGYEGNATPWLSCLSSSFHSD